MNNAIKPTMVLNSGRLVFIANQTTIANGYVGWRLSGAIFNLTPSKIALYRSLWWPEQLAIHDSGTYRKYNN